MYAISGIPRFEKPLHAPLIQFQNKEEKATLRRIIDTIRIDPQRFVRSPMPLWIGGKSITYSPNKLGLCVAPHNLGCTLGTYVCAAPCQVEQAIESTLQAREQWMHIPWFFRLNIFRKAAYLLQHKYFYKAVAVVMEDYSKNPYEAMIDVCELIDFWNFNVWFACQIYNEQPENAAHEFNYADYRPLQGFVAAIPPNNFVSIALNLPTAPLVMGNVVVCKPAPETIFSFHFMLAVLHEAGLPKDVLSVVHGDEQMIGEELFSHNQLAAVHFTGSMNTMEMIVENVGQNIKAYKNFPRVVGESGGKNPAIIYDDANLAETVSGIVKSAFGAQGRKCSALSRLYLTRKKWQQMRPPLLRALAEIKVGDVADFKNYLGAVISQQEFNKITRYMDHATSCSSTAEVMGGTYSSLNGWWIHPTIVVMKDSHCELMSEEIFGPVLTVLPMPKEEFEEKAVALCAEDTPYRLTAKIGTEDIYTLARALRATRDLAGNIYDWGTTGAVVNRQWFGGGGKSGSNSKPGSKINLYHWTNPQNVCLLHLKPNHFIPGYLELT